jgi:hypothetical protein
MAYKEGSWRIYLMNYSVIRWYLRYYRYIEGKASMPYFMSPSEYYLGTEN